MNSKTFNLMNLSPGALKLYMVLIAYNGFDKVCFPSMDTLKKSLGIAWNPKFKKYRDELVRYGLVKYQTYFTTAEGTNGKKYQKPQGSYTVVKYDSYFTTIDGINTLSVHFSSGKVDSGYNQNLTGYNTYSSSIEEKKSLFSLTKDERRKIALDLHVPLEIVFATEREVLRPENIKKHDIRNAYLTTRNWIRSSIRKNFIKTLDNTGYEALKTLYGKDSS